jgi:hypothetical protein
MSETSNSSARKDVYGASGSNIYGCWGIYLKNEAVFDTSSGLGIGLEEGRDRRMGKGGRK